MAGKKRGLSFGAMVAIAVGVATALFGSTYLGSENTTADDETAQNSNGAA